MKFALFTLHGAQNSPPVFKAIQQGLEKLGHEVVFNQNDADVAVIWSVLWSGHMTPNKAVFQHYQSQGKPVMVAEIGSLRRGELWRISIFDPQQRYPLPEDPLRWSDLGLSYRQRPTRGENIVIACQRSDSLQWEGQPNTEQWIQKMIDRIRLFTSRPIIVRPHPRQIIFKHFSETTTQYPQKIPGSYDSFDFDVALNNARVVINHNASCAITSVLAGVPVITGLNGMTASLAQEVSIGFDEIEGTRIGSGTEDWLNKIAHTEWTIDEIASGVPISLLL